MTWNPLRKKLLDVVVKFGSWMKCVRIRLTPLMKTEVVLTMRHKRKKKRRNYLKLRKMSRKKTMKMMTLRRIVLMRN
jgi:hypothetical protein